MVARTTSSPDAAADAVCVFATLKKAGLPDETLLVRQVGSPAHTALQPQAAANTTNSKPPFTKTHRRHSRQSTPLTPVVFARSQFRPPLRGETIELPAGLIDTGESAAQAALRELKEETGYTGTVTGATRSMALSPGLSNESVVMVSVQVDMDAAENREPAQELEGSEFITVIRVPLGGLRATLEGLEGRGYSVFAGLYMMAIGMEFGAAGGGPRL
jgi:8-oxo-dGTP pyrophosphatase MutT (NUDIX family)